MYRNLGSSIYTNKNPISSELRINKTRMPSYASLFEGVQKKETRIPNKPKLKKRKSIQPYQLSHADVVQLSKLQSYRNPKSFYKK